jgi:hypothetical protein
MRTEDLRDRPSVTGGWRVSLKESAIASLPSQSSALIKTQED